MGDEQGRGELCRKRVTATLRIFAPAGQGESLLNLAADEVLQRISVVLPCAGEERYAIQSSSRSVPLLPCLKQDGISNSTLQGQYALNTVRAVYESLPADVLHEIIVVDDGSEPPLTESYLTRDVVKRFKVTIIRHARSLLSSIQPACDNQSPFM